MARPSTCSSPPDTGGIINDPVLLRLAENHFWLALADSDVLLWARGVAVRAGMRVTITEPDVSPLQLQGPKSKDVAKALFGDRVLDLEYYHFFETSLDGIPVVVTPRMEPRGIRDLPSRRSKATRCGSGHGRRLPTASHPRAPSGPLRVEAASDWRDILLENAYPWVEISWTSRDERLHGKEAAACARGRDRSWGVEIAGPPSVQRLTWPSSGAAPSAAYLVISSPRLKRTWYAMVRYSRPSSARGSRCPSPRRGSARPRWRRSRSWTRRRRSRSRRARRPLYDFSLTARSNASRTNGMSVRSSSAVRTRATCETRLPLGPVLMKNGALTLRPR